MNRRLSWENILIVAAISGILAILAAIELLVIGTVS